MDLQEIKIYVLHKAVLIKACLAVTPEFPHIGIQPDRSAQIKFMAHLIQSTEYLVCPGILRLIAHSRILYHVIVLKHFRP